MKELSTSAKAGLMAAATLIIGFSMLAACRGNGVDPAAKQSARGVSQGHADPGDR